MRCNRFKRNNFFGKTGMQTVPGLQFSRSEVLGRQQQPEQPQKSYKRDSTWSCPRIVTTAKRGTRLHKRIILMMVTGLALGMFVLYNSFPWVTELGGCVYYLVYCQYPTVIAVLLICVSMSTGFPIK